MVTMIHTERNNRDRVTVQIIGTRFEVLFHRNAIVISTEMHKDGTYHHHVGISNENASKNISGDLERQLVERIRAKFPEWEGRSINVSTQRSWKGILAYVTKFDKNPYILGQQTKNEILYIAECYENNKQAIEQKKQDKKEILQTLGELTDFFHAYRHELLIPRILTQAAKLRDAYEDLQVVKFKEGNFYASIIDYL